MTPSIWHVDLTIRPRSITYLVGNKRRCYHFSSVPCSRPTNNIAKIISAAEDRRRGGGRWRVCGTVWRMLWSTLTSLQPCWAHILDIWNNLVHASKDKQSQQQTERKPYDDIHASELNWPILCTHTVAGSTVNVYGVYIVKRLALKPLSLYDVLRRQPAAG